MFNFSEWVVKGVIDGFKTGLTPFAKGIITQEQAESIAVACPGPAIESEVEEG